MNELLNELLAMAAAGSCQDTIAGWLWFCDTHDTHGNADTEDEASFVADAHAEFWALDGDDGECVIVVAKVRSS